MFDKKYWVWLSLAFDVANAVSDKLLLDFAYDPEAIYNASRAELSEALPENCPTLHRLLNKDMSRAEEIMDHCEAHNIGILTQDSHRYPSSLLTIRGRPIVLYYKGSLPELSERLAVGIVGTRRVSEYGSSSAYSISYDLAKAGAIIVSGMASGTDGIAHQGALDAMGQTVAVLGSGIDVVYPKENLRLYQELIMRGTVISEYQPGSRPEGWHFPQRNRIISGLSQGVLVVEAAEKSGSLITAEHAKKQGRLLYAVPGKVGELTSLGTNGLIRQGAKMVTNANDILTDFSSLYSFDRKESPRTHNAYRRFRSPGDPMRVAHQISAVPLELYPEDNSSSYMSMEIDPRLVAARKAKQELDELRKRSRLAYPDEATDENGYDARPFWEHEVGAYERDRASKQPTANASDDTEAREAQKKALSTERDKASRADRSKLSEDEQKLIAFIEKHGKATADELTSMGIPIHIISGKLTLMEIEGVIECLEGGYYCLK